MNDPSQSAQEAHRLHQVIQAPLEAIEDLLTAQGVSVQHAEPGSYINVHLYDVAAVIVDGERVPGTVVRAHRPAYLRQDGSVIRKGAAVVTGHDAAVPTDPQSMSG